MSHIIIVDLRESNGHVLTIDDEHDNIAQFDTEKEANALMEDHPLNAFPFYVFDTDRI